MSKPTDRVIDAAMWRTIVFTGLVMAVAALVTLDSFMPGGFIAGDESLDTARTAAFTVLVLAQLFNAFNARSDSASAFQDLFDNRWLWGAVLAGLVLQVAVVEWSFLNLSFGTTPLTAGQWAWCLVISSSVLWLSELRKVWLRRVAAPAP